MLLLIACVWMFQAEYEVLERATAAPRAAPERFRPTQTPSPPEIHRHSSSGAAFSPAAPFMAHNGLHDSFIADAVKLRDGWRPGAQVCCAIPLRSAFRKSSISHRTAYVRLNDKM